MHYGDMDRPFVVNFGPCCACRRADVPAHLVIMLPFKRLDAEDGSGWGCHICGLPDEGALAVVCEACTLQPDLAVLDAVKGFLPEKQRCLVADLSDPFLHDMAEHAQREAEIAQRWAEIEAEGVDGQ